MTLALFHVDFEITTIGAYAYGFDSSVLPETEVSRWAEITIGIYTEDPEGSSDSSVMDGNLVLLASDGSKDKRPGWKPFYSCSGAIS